MIRLPSRRSPGPEDGAPMIYFAHIGKTAGTSFRNAVLKRIGRRRCVFLYSPTHRIRTREASEIFFRGFTKGGDNGPAADAVLDYCREQDARFFATHHNELFKRRIPPAATLAFVREPLARLISHYNFSLASGWIDADLGFPAFMARRRFRNLQSRSLLMRRYDDIGLICLTERFETSLKAIGETFGLTVKPMRYNVTPAHPAAIRATDLAREEVEAVRRRHARDFALYDRARADFDARWGREA